MNTKYNKAVYGALSLIIAQGAALLAQQYGVDITPEQQAMIVTVIVPFVVYLVPNRGA